MFESMFTDVAEDALVALIEQAAREEAQAAARRLSAIAELVYRTVDEDDERGWWACDPWDNTAARVGAALRVGQRRASGQMRIAVALRDRLPKIAALFCKGEVSSRVVSQITWRTHLVGDDELIAHIDTALAERAQGWEPKSERALASAIDAAVERHDPDAVRRARELIRTRDLHVGARDDGGETTAVWGRLLATDGEALERRLGAMARAVCDSDPRSLGERRSDALGAMIQGNDHLTCRCGSSECPADLPARSNVVIRVVADRAAVEAAHEAASRGVHQSRPGEPGDRQSRPIGAEVPDAVPPRSESAPGRFRDAGVAVLLGRGVLPAAVLTEAIRAGAKVKPLMLPHTEPEPHYRPSAELAEFIRMRDLHCRFPGCDVSADRCDIDHVEPWPLGPTHPSNLNCKCRTHHLLKTFWGGPGGWIDKQRSDGTVTWTAPDGQVYITRPGSDLFFPEWNTTTADLPPPQQATPPDPARAMMMPKRRRRREADEAARIAAERALPFAVGY